MQFLLSLIGLPGSGKSTLGRQLARRLKMPFLDSDSVIEQRLGCSIREYFEREGEAHFRDLEADVIDELTQQGPSVLSTGGGVVLREVNRLNLRSRTRVVYLNSSPDELFRRLKHDKSRPLLQVPDPLGRLRDLHTQRDPLYRQTAHFNIDTGRPSVSSLVHTIASELSATGVAARWSDMVKGAADLSINPMHIQGFGQ